MKADMHVHSDVSDGSESIENIIEQAKRKGLDAIAITDHDTLSQSRKIPEKPGIRVICGAEISCEHRKSKTRVHLLAYNVQKPEIIKNLDGRNLLYKSIDYEHSYPFCWRCDTPLLYYARST
ncbi:MAG TPA: PHP domain-containing protein, partial [Bacillota bacterium]|nr:PHP domain-containing protein [Bacillota bacterium]